MSRRVYLFRICIAFVTGFGVGVHDWWLVTCGAISMLAAFAQVDREALRRE